MIKSWSIKTVKFLRKAAQGKAQESPELCKESSRWKVVPQEPTGQLMKELLNFGGSITLLQVLFPKSFVKLQLIKIQI